MRTDEMQGGMGKSRRIYRKTGEKLCACSSPRVHDGKGLASYSGGYIAELERKNKTKGNLDN